MKLPNRHRVILGMDSVSVEPQKALLPKVVCVVGPTSAGKTCLGIQLAKHFHGEVVNADARQVYRGFEIGTGKPAGVRETSSRGRDVLMVEDVPHHLMNMADPDHVMTVGEWREQAMVAIQDISAHDRLPILVGGTGLYIQAIVDNYHIPEVPPQPAFREEMDERSLEDLVRRLREIDPAACEIVDLKNKRRVMRALEVVHVTGRSFASQRLLGEPLVDALLIAPTCTKDVLNANISATIDDMIQRGWVEEVKRLHDQGVDWEDPAMTSIGYRELGAYLREEMPLEDAIEKIKQATRQYAKRQLTWFNKDKRIHWVKDGGEAQSLVSGWLDCKE